MADPNGRHSTQENSNKSGGDSRAEDLAKAKANDNNLDQEKMNLLVKDAASYQKEKEHKIEEVKHNNEGSSLAVGENDSDNSSSVDIEDSLYSKKEKERNKKHHHKHGTYYFFTKLREMYIDRVLRKYKEIFGRDKIGIYHRNKILNKATEQSSAYVSRAGEKLKKMASKAKWESSNAKKELKYKLSKNYQSSRDFIQNTVGTLNKKVSLGNGIEFSAKELMENVDAVDTLGHVSKKAGIENIENEKLRQEIRELDSSADTAGLNEEELIQKRDFLAENAIEKQKGEKQKEIEGKRKRIGLIRKHEHEERLKERFIRSVIKNRIEVKTEAASLPKQTKYEVDKTNSERLRAEQRRGIERRNERKQQFYRNMQAKIAANGR